MSIEPKDLIVGEVYEIIECDELCIIISMVPDLNSGSKVIYMGSNESKSEFIFMSEQGETINLSTPGLWHINKI